MDGDKELFLEIVQTIRVEGRWTMWEEQLARRIKHWPESLQPMLFERKAHKEWFDICIDALIKRLKVEVKDVEAK